jgi:hypothetical protein
VACNGLFDRFLCVGLLTMLIVILSLPTIVRIYHRASPVVRVTVKSDSRVAGSRSVAFMQMIGDMLGVRRSRVPAIRWKYLKVLLLLIPGTQVR